ncbi:MAG: nucleoside 2-deoxyribosyltransferase [Vicinamibacterales bacterium]
MRVYLACTIRGDRSRLAVARALGAAIEAAGHDLMTARFLEERAEDEDGRLTPAQVFERDLAWLDACEVLVAEASGSSYGVGFEVGYVLSRAARSGQRVVLLYDAALAERVSRMITGNTHPCCTTAGYRDAAEARARLEAALAAVSAGGDRRGPVPDASGIR